MLTVQMAARRLGVSPGLIYGLVSSGRLRCYRVGNGRGVIRFSEEHLSAYLAGVEPGIKDAPAPAPSSRRIDLKHLHLN